MEGINANRQRKGVVELGNGAAAFGPVGIGNAQNRFIVLAKYQADVVIGCHYGHCIYTDIKLKAKGVALPEVDVVDWRGLVEIDVHGLTPCPSPLGEGCPWGRGLLNLKYWLLILLVLFFKDV
jgi:hypothetical protein